MVYVKIQFIPKKQRGGRNNGMDTFKCLDICNDLSIYLCSFKRGEEMKINKLYDMICYDLIFTGKISKETFLYYKTKKRKKK